MGFNSWVLVSAAAMNNKKKNKKAISPSLVIESHPEDYEGVPWATLIQYAGRARLVVVNTLELDFLWAYGIENMNTQEYEIFYEVMEDYWTRTLYGEPVRARVSPDQWISERKLGSIFGKIISAYSVENISRIIGPVRYPDPSPPKTRVRRRKRIEINKDLIKKR